MGRVRLSHRDSRDGGAEVVVMGFFGVFVYASV